MYEIVCAAVNIKCTVFSRLFVLKVKIGSMLITYSDKKCKKNNPKNEHHLAVVVVNLFGTVFSAIYFACNVL